MTSTCQLHSGELLLDEVQVLGGGVGEVAVAGDLCVRGDGAALARRPQLQPELPHARLQYTLTLALALEYLSARKQFSTVTLCMKVHHSKRVKELKHSLL